MTRAMLNVSPSPRRRSTLVEQPWDAMKWFWRFSRFYGRYLPRDLDEKQRLTEAHL